MLTAKQYQTLQFITKYISDNGIAPTEAEIAIGIGITSRGVVHRYVTALAQAGKIKITPNKRRNIELIDENQRDYILPIIGRIAAGVPIEAIPDDRDINILDSLLGNNRYILEVKGDSMVGDNICDGDFIICEHCSTASNGTIVVALIDGQEATLKRIQFNQDDSITLIPSNPTINPMTFSPDRVQIQGVYLGLLRMAYSHL